jgi:EAL domain-containing protein (putative c-di-GMP-specific phosphodiesterase class I)
MSVYLLFSISSTILILLFIYQFYNIKSVVAMEDISHRIGYQFELSGTYNIPTQATKLVSDLRKAINYSELKLYYQPILNSKREIVAMEALLRWDHPKHGFILPEKIIELAETNQLIDNLGEWVLKTACLQTVEWQRAGQHSLRMSVNVSPKQFLDQQFVSKVKNILIETNLEPKYLELEITENVNMLDIEYTLSTLHELKKLGVTITVDDFGTGYSSLEYIDQLPIDHLKIDKSFVMNMNTMDEKTQVIANTIISLAKNLNMKVVAEGVESIQQYKLLSENSCHMFQGYYFYKPLDPSDCIKVFENVNMVNQN